MIYSSLLLLALGASGSPMEPLENDYLPAGMTWRMVSITEAANGIYSFRLMLFHMDSEMPNGVNFAYPYKFQHRYYDNQFQQIPRRTFFKMWDRTDLPSFEEGKL